MLRTVLTVVLAVALTGCGLDLPRDPGRSLDQVRESGVLRVGATLHDPWVTLPDGVEGTPAGSEPALVIAFAESLGAEVEWVVGAESELVTGLEEDELDVVVAGWAADTPYVASVALTRPYTEQPDDKGQLEPHVMAVPMGENALLSALEQFLDEAAR